jgi:Fe-S-cluster-containing dehydrogenase component/CRP-like cAMP-binding protein
MPQEKTNRDEVLAALAKTAALAELSSHEPGRGLPAAELRALLDGHAYAGQSVAPYLRLLSYAPGEEIVREGAGGGDRFFFLVSGVAEVFVRRNWAKVGELQPGTLFGEMSVLAQLPRSSTVCAAKESAVELLEVQRPALRWLRKSPAFAQVLDKAYRRNSRAITLQEVGLATRLDAESLSKLATISQFRVCEKGHTLFREGEPVRRLFVLRTGWVALSRLGEPEGGETLAQTEYLGAGYCFGLEGMASDLPWPQTGVLLARAEVLEISLPLLREAETLLEDILTGLKKLAPPAELARQPQPLPIAVAQRELIQTGVAETTNLLAIDAHLCTRCGNCALTCHELHGQSRLSRRGFTVTRPVELTPRARQQPLIIPSACHHCRQPECLAGCPVNALRQQPDGRVELLADSCIGCGDCVALCPYEAISLIERPLPLSGEPGEAATDGPPGSPQFVAVKCDLCSGAACNADVRRPHVYGCEENCPTGALRRVRPFEQFAELRTLVQPRWRRTQRKQQEPATLHRTWWEADRTQVRLHAAGVALTLLLAVLLAVQRQHGLLWPGTARSFHWMTGWLGAVGLAGTWAYTWRKRQRTRRGGALRYWLLAHSYTALVTLGVFALHCGERVASPFAQALVMTLGLTFLSGLLGQLINWAVPRWLTAQESQPWLLEDLLARRAELQTAGKEEAAETLPKLNRLIFGQWLLRGWVLPHLVFAVALLVLLLVHVFQVVFFHWR